MSTTSEIQEKLKGRALFADFTSAELDEFVELLDVVRAVKGDVVVRQDDSGDCMFVLVEGSARVVHHRNGREIELAVLNPGDFFGEIALVDDGPRSADVRALEDCTLLKVTQAVISAVAGVYPSAAFKFLIAIGRTLIGRLRRTNQVYIDSLLLPFQGKD